MNFNFDETMAILDKITANAIHGSVAPELPRITVSNVQDFVLFTLRKLIAGK